MSVIVLGSDHAGFQLKELLDRYIRIEGFAANVPINVGCYNEESCDYPEYAHQLVQNMVPHLCKAGIDDVFGILVCGSGQGMCMTANKYSYIRAGLAHSTEDAKMMREHNNANVLCIGARTLDAITACETVKTFLTTTNSKEERHIRRVEKINKTNHE